MSTDKPHSSADRIPFVTPALLNSRLLLAKNVYNHAVDHTLKPGPLNKIIAVHGLHMSLEILLRAIALVCNVREPKKGLSFMELANGINSSQKATEAKMALPYMPQLSELTNWRNLAQHSAIQPPETLLSEWSVFVGAFLRQAALQFLGIEFEGLSQLDLIENVRIRDLLGKAEAFRKSLEANADKSTEDDEAYRSYQTALAILAITFAIAFGEAILCIGRAAVDRVVEIPSSLMFLDAGTALSDLWRRTRELELASLFSVLGVDYWAYQELAEHAPSIVLGQRQKPWISVRNEADPDPQQLRRLIDFETALVLDWQAKGMVASVTIPGSDAFRIAADYILAGRKVRVSGLDTTDMGKRQMTMDLSTVMLQGYRQYMTYLTCTL